MNSKEALEILKEIVGDELYEKIIDELKGTTVYFPSDFEWHDKNERNVQLRNDFYSGRYEISDLAKKYNLSISHVYKIVQKKV